MTTALPINQQVNLNSLAIETQDADLTGNLTVAGNATISGTLTAANKAPAYVSLTASTYAPTIAQSGSTFAFNRTSNGSCTVTLPATTQIGTEYTFVVGTVSTGAYKVITSAGTIFISGSMIINKAGTVTAYVADGSTDVAVNFNGSTTGGVNIGDYFKLTCLSATEWGCQGITVASGTLATPFTTS